MENTYPNLTSDADRWARSNGFDRRGAQPAWCECQWSSRYHGDICPEHGGPGVPIPSELEARGARIAELEAQRDSLLAVAESLAAMADAWCPMAGECCAPDGLGALMEAAMEVVAKAKGRPGPGEGEGR